MNGKREFGDYQTPPDFALQLCQLLRDGYGLRPSVVIEPTCGVGGFLAASQLFQAEEYYGIEINPRYCEECRGRLAGTNALVINASIFDYPVRSLVRSSGEVLIIGNPPWVTSSDLSVLGSSNTPHKSNFKGAVGLAALTGDSNFDICETIILQMLTEFRGCTGALAMLCKKSVSRRIFQEAKRLSVSFTQCDFLEIDARRVFGVSVEAGMLVMRLGGTGNSPEACRVYEFAPKPIYRGCFGFREGRFYSEVGDENVALDGECCFEWRQGVKHDCSRIMELERRDGRWCNGQREELQIEDEIVFPLVKSSMFKTPIISDFSKYVIVTQRRVGEDTHILAERTPRTWRYLNRNIRLFEQRRSAIYRGAPPFAMFGVGEYSYCPYKVGVSGFYKRPLFSMLYSKDNKPVMIDDTGYFIGFDEYDLAYVAMLVLNSSPVQHFLSTVAFSDAKRPYTKRVLKRISIQQAVCRTEVGMLAETERQLGLSSYVTADMYERFKALCQRMAEGTGALPAALK